MSDISLLPFALSISGLLALMLLLLAVIMLPETDSDTWFTRTFQQLLLKRTRLGKLLTLRGADQSAFLHSQNIAQMRTLRKNCRGCDNFYYCDEQVKKGKTGYRDLNFCPNREALSQVLRD